MANKKYMGIGIGIGAVVIVVLFFLVSSGAAGYSTLENFEGEITISKDTSCGCCGIYAKYFQERGNENAKVVSVEDVELVKDEYDIPAEIRSCHTVSIGDYYVEGHVPLEAVEKLLQEKPDIAGLAMSGMKGMPAGSPGMPGEKSDDWIIYAVNHDGSYEEWMVI